LNAPVNGTATVDELRVYRTDLTDSQLQSLYTIGTENALQDELDGYWATDAIPFSGANKQLGGATAGALADATHDADALRDARHINHASGEHLTDLGTDIGIPRRGGESDDKYRARIKSTIIAAQSRGTADDVIDAAAGIVETDAERIELDTRYDTDPATVFVYIKTADLDDTLLTAQEVETLLGDAVFAGHRVRVRTQGTTVFRVTDDASTNDPDNGLTSDSVSTGGELVSDA
jgi:hypothetical protein